MSNNIKWTSEQQPPLSWSKKARVNDHTAWGRQILSTPFLGCKQGVNRGPTAHFALGLQTGCSSAVTIHTYMVLLWRNISTSVVSSHAPELTTATVTPVSLEPCVCICWVCSHSALQVLGLSLPVRVISVDTLSIARTSSEPSSQASM